MWRRNTVLADEYIHHLIGRIGALVECDAVFLVMGCPEKSLRHALLDRIPIEGYQVIAGPSSIEYAALLQHERMLAACDIAMQSGQIHSLTGVEGNTVNHASLTFTIAPLERPTGILGLILFANARPDAIAPGERLLLQQYLPTIAQRMEAHLIKLVEKQTEKSSDQCHAQHQLQQPHEFMSIMAHELRSPLTAIKGYAALLQAYGYAAEHPDEDEAGEFSPERRREYLDIIMEQVKHLEVLITDILDLTRIQSGHPILRPAYLNCALLCQRAIQLVQQQAERQHPGTYTFRTKFPAHVPFIWADADRLQQILTNLLDNAVKYSPGGGSIELAVTVSSLPRGEQTETKQAQISTNGLQAKEMVAITVQDWGIGIPHGQQQNLFAPFRRFANAASHGIPGVGLGLYITRRLVEAMAGTITVSSQEGEGTTVTVMFPAAQPEHLANLELTHSTLQKRLRDKRGSLH
jgi:signal transduction histidine kinase